MAFSLYERCDLAGDAANALRSVNQVISDIAAEIDLAIDTAIPGFTAAGLAVDDLLEAIDNLLIDADAPELKGLDRFTDTLGLLDPDAAIADEEARLSLTGLAVINGTALLQCNGENINEIRKLVKLVGLTEAERLCRVTRAGEKIIIITKLNAFKVGPVNNAAPSIAYINSTFNLSITEADVTYVAEGNVISEPGIAPQSIPTTAVVHTETVIGRDIPLSKAAMLGGIPEDQLHIHIFSFCGSQTASNGQAMLKTVGFNGSSFGPNNYNLKIKVNGNSYELDVTGNKGASSSYEAALIAANINWQLTDIDVTTVGNELIFKSKKSGATSSIEFLDASTVDASVACGITSALLKIIDESLLIQNVNVKIGSGNDYQFSSEFGGVKATVNTRNPQKPSDLPSVVIRGGNVISCSKFSRADTIKFQTLGITGNRLTAATTAANLAESNPDVITDTVTEAQITFTKVANILDTKVVSASQAQAVLKQALALTNKTLETFDVAKSDVDFTFTQITSPDMFEFLGSVGLSDDDIEDLFLNRTDIKCIDTTALDLDVGNKISDLLNSPPGSVGLSTKKLNQPLDQEAAIKNLFFSTESQLEALLENIKTVYVEAKASPGFTVSYFQSKVKTLSDSAKVVQGGLNNVTISFEEILEPEPEKIKGYKTYDTPGSLIFRTVDPSKTFNFSNEAGSITEAAGLYYDKATQEFLGAIVAATDNAVKVYSGLNKKVQDEVRYWMRRLEAGVGSVLNLTDKDDNLIKCTFNTKNMLDLVNGLMNIGALIPDVQVKIDAAMLALRNIITLFTDKLLCVAKTINSLIAAKSQIEGQLSGLAIPFNCVANLDMSVVPQITALINSITLKLNIIASIPTLMASQLRHLTGAVTTLLPSINFTIPKIEDCMSNTVKDMFGAQSELFRRAAAVREAFGSIYVPSKSLTAGFSLPQPPANLGALISKPSFQLPKIPK